MEERDDIYCSLSANQNEDFDATANLLDTYFEPKKNVTFETYSFRKLVQ